MGIRQRRQGLEVILQPAKSLERWPSYYEAQVRSEAGTVKLIVQRALHPRRKRIRIERIEQLPQLLPLLQQFPSKKNHERAGCWVGQVATCAKRRSWTTEELCAAVVGRMDAWWV